MPSLMSGTFPDKAIRYPHNAEGKNRVSGNSKVMKVLSVSKASSVDRWHGWFRIRTKPVATVDGRSGFSSLCTLCDALGPCVSIWGVQLVWSLQSGILRPTGLWTAARLTFLWFGRFSQTLKVFPFCASWYCHHGSHGIYFLKSKESSILSAIYTEFKTMHGFKSLRDTGELGCARRCRAAG